MRKQSREVVFKLIFAQHFGQYQNDDFENLLSVVLNDMALKENDVDLDYVRNTFVDVTSNFDRLSKQAYSKVQKYANNRIYNADLVILVLAIYELEQKALDTKIVISEAVKLAKKYSTQNSIKFVNGVLSAIAKEMYE